MVVVLYALAGWFFCLGAIREEEGEESGPAGLSWPWALLAGLLLGCTALAQVIQIWAVLAALGLGWVCLRQGKWAMGVGLVLALGLFMGWLLRLWLVCGNPIGLNWAFLLVDSPRFPGEMVWRTYTFDIEKTDVWRRVGGSILRGFTDLILQGPALVGNAVAGTLALVS